MYIKRLRASFGKLQNAELTLQNGLNIISAPNEFGKSTWTAFIRSMLYGVDTKDRDKKNYISDKNRYNPWSGAPMEGIMELECMNRPITIERSSQGGPMQKFSARYGSGESITELTGESAGLHLIGVEREVFERSCFIAQTALGVSNSPELERRLQALVSSGDENVSFSETELRLKQWLNKRRHNKTGELPAIEAQLSETEDKLLELQKDNKEMLELSLAIERLIPKRDALRNELSQIDNYAKMNRLLKLKDAEAELTEAVRETEELGAGFKDMEFIPTHEQLTAAMRGLSALEALKEQASSARKKADEAALTDESSGSTFKGLSADEAWQLSASEGAKYKELFDRSQKKNLLLPVIFGLLAILSACSDFFISSSTWLLVSLGGAVLFAGLCVLFIVHSGNQKKADASAAARILEKYSVSSLDALVSAASRYREMISNENSLRMQKDSLEADAVVLGSEYSSKRESIFELIGKLTPEAPDEQAAIEAVTGLDNKVMAYNAALQRLEAAKKLHSSLSAGEQEDGVIEAVDAPERTRAEVSVELSQLSSEINRLSTALTMLEGARKVLGDGAALNARKEALENRRDTLLKQYEAIELALEKLKNADTELQNRFSPRLNHRAGEIMNVFTGGKYNNIFLDKSFNATVEEAGEVSTRKLLSLSQGTVDQLYLAVRLAVCDVVLPSDNPTPIILDDALTTFDKTRLSAVLNWLRLEAQWRQIILFTCHSREADFFKDDPDVNIIYA